MEDTLVFRRIYPVEAIDVALLLAVVPYFLLRGPVNRIARVWVGGRFDDADPRAP